MRACRRFRAGIPHRWVGSHVLLTRPPLPARKQGVRLACVRHAASVYPEPGSNSPSIVIYCPHGISRVSHSCRVIYDPGQAADYCPVLGCSQISRSPCGRASRLTGTAVSCVHASTQLLFCFPLFSCQSATGNKSCLFLYCHLETDTEHQKPIPY
jgi:hypothetical protein